MTSSQRSGLADENILKMKQWNFTSSGQKDFFFLFCTFGLENSKFVRRQKCSASLGSGVGWCFIPQSRFFHKIFQTIICQSDI